MATKLKVEPRGSMVLKGIIAFLILVLIISILYPGKLWKEHEEMITDSRERIENLNFIVNRFQTVNGSYIADLDSLLGFMETDSITVKRSLLEIEKLSLYDADYDSFIVGFTDLFHFDRVEFFPFKDGVAASVTEENNDTSVDSVVLRMMPKEAFADVIAPVEYYMSAPKGLKYYFRGKGDKDIYWLIWSDGKVARDYLPYEEKLVPTKDYVLFRDLADLRVDPITGKEFLLNLNKRIEIEGKVDYVIPRRGEPDTTIVGNELKTNLLLNRMARKARSRLDQDMQRDSTLFDMQLELQGDYFDVELDLIRPGRAVTVEADKEIMLPADSVDNYRSKERMEMELYKVTYDSLTRSWLQLEKFQNLVNAVEFTESVGITKESVVGVTIKAPFEGKTYKLKSRNILDAIFSVGPIDNPGFVENNDLSWSETK